MLETVAFALSLLIMVISFGCEIDEDELLIPANTTNENQGMLKSSPVTGIYPEGMVGYWKFDEGSGTTAYDAMGDNDGTIQGATWTTGIVGNALSFNGSGNRVLLGFIASTDHVTLEAWVKLPSDPVYDSPIIAKERASGYGGSYNLALQPTRQPRFLINVGVYWDFLYSPNLIDVNVWYHLAGTYDGSEMKIYVNGELKSTLPVVGSVQEGGKPVYIGNNGGGRYHKGLIDEVAIYNRALTACEVNQHYQNGLDGFGYELVQATIDIDPNTLNLKSKGKTVTAYIEFPEDFNVTEIDISTVYLEGSIPAKLHPSEVGDYDDDNIPDLMVKFDQKALIEYLDGVTGETTLTIKGEIDEAPVFAGSDIITVIYP